MTAGRARLLAAAGYLLVFVVAFYVALVLAFPTEALKQAVTNAVARDSGLALVIGELSHGWRGDLHGSGVALVWSQAGRSVPLFVADRIDLRFALRPLLRGRLEAEFSGRAYDGSFEGRFEGPIRSGATADRLTLRVARLDLGRHAGLKAAVPVVIAGRLSGELALASRPAAQAAARAEPPRGPTGTVRLTVAEGSVRELPVVGASLPALTVESATARATLDGERLDVQALELRGPEVSLSASGQIVFRQPLSASTLTGTLRLRPERRLPPALRQLLAGLARNPDSTGAYGFVLVGTLGAPGVQPL